MSRLLSILERFWRAPFAPAAVVLAATWAVLWLGHPPAFLHSDTHEDLLLARACIEDGRCATAGASTTMPGVEQGALWISLLAVWRAAGLSIAAIQALVFLLAAVSVALLFAYLRPRSPRLAWATAALTALAWLYGGSLSVLWNPSLTPLPAALLFVVGLDHAERGRWWGPLSLGLALGLTVETHPVAVLLAPGALVLAGASCRSRLWAFLAPVVAAALAFGLYAGISPAAALANARAAVGAAGVLLPVGALVLVGTAGLSQPWLRRASESRRTLIAAAALALPVLVAVAARRIVSDQAPLGPRYVAPAIAPLAYLIGRGADRLLARRPAAATLSLAALVAALWPAFHARVDERTLSGVEAVERSFRRRGVTLDEAYARVSGPACREVLGGLAALGLPFGGPLQELSHESVVVGMANEIERAGGDPARFGRGRWEVLSAQGGDVVVGELDAWIDRRRFSACVFTDAGGDPICIERDMRAGVKALMGPELMLARLSEPYVEWRDDPHAGGLAERVVYRLPVRVPPGAGTRTLSIPVVGRYECHRTRFVAFEGVPVTGALPSTTVSVRSTDSWQEGTAVVEAERGSCGYLDVFPPCTSEIAEDDEPAMRRVLEH